MSGLSGGATYESSPSSDQIRAVDALRIARTGQEVDQQEVTALPNAATSPCSRTSERPSGSICSPETGLRSRATTRSSLRPDHDLARSSMHRYRSRAPRVNLDLRRNGRYSMSPCRPAVDQVRVVSKAGSGIEASATSGIISPSDLFDLSIIFWRKHAFVQAILDLGNPACNGNREKCPRLTRVQSVRGIAAPFS